MTEAEERVLRELGLRVGRLERALALQAGIVTGLEYDCGLDPADDPRSDEVVRIIQGRHDEQE